MKKKHFYKLITSLLVVSFVATPFSAIPQKAQAQGISAYTSGLLPAITQLPLCRGKLTGATRFLFGSSLASDAIGTSVNQLIKSTSLSNKFQEASSDADSIQISDPVTRDILRQLDEQMKAIRISTTSLDESDTCLKSIGRMVIKMLLQKITMSTVAWINSGFDGKPAFIQDPGKFFNDIAKNEILQFGLEIGDPALFPFGTAWLQNQAMAFNNRFADNARYSLGEMIDATNPNAVAEFNLDFSQGGWNAWTAMTQYPANNPLGFQLIADTEIQRRLQGTVQSTAQNTRDALQAASGFLGDERCADPVGLSMEQHEAGLVARANGDMTAPICNRREYVTPGKLISEAATNAINYPNNNLLRAEDLNDAMAAIMDALLSKFSSDLMQKGFASMGSEGADGSMIYDPSARQAGTHIRSQTAKDFTPTHLASSWLQTNPDFNIRTDLTQALIDEQRTYADKLKIQNKELNSTTDGKDYANPFLDTTWTHCANEGPTSTCSVPSNKIYQVRYGANGSYFYQQTTINNLTQTTGIACKNETFGDPISGTPKTCAYAPLPNAYGLIPAIAQLDYCMPGPHPGFEEDSQVALNAIVNIIPAVSENDLDNTSMGEIGEVARNFAPLAGAAIGTALATAGATVGSVVPIVGTVIGAAVGALAGVVIGWLTSENNYAKVQLYYYAHFVPITGVTAGSDGGRTQKPKAISAFGSKGGFVQTLNIILERYTKLAYKVYNPKILPAIYREAASEFRKLKGYSQMIVNNEEAIATTKNVVYTLEEIKNVVDALNANYPNEGDEYENQLRAQINAFGRVSASMVNGDDIASVDNLTRQIIDEKNYVYNDLLKGPFGCERDLQDGKQNMPDHLYATKRMNYIYPILYTYDIPAGGDIPDPWDSGYINKTNDKATALYGPGFLSAYFFQTNGRYKALDGVDDCKASENGVVPILCQIQLQDILPLRQPGDGDWRLVSPGLIPANNNSIVNLRGQGDWSTNITPFTLNSGAKFEATGPFEGMMGLY